MAKLLMSRDTAGWLVDNTKLTFEQIAKFCGFHPLEVQKIANDEHRRANTAHNPVLRGQLTAEELARCEADPKATLQITSEQAYPSPKARSKGPRYTPIKKRADKPNAIAWLVKDYPTLPDSVIIKLIGTTKKTILAIRDRSHSNTANIKPQDPVALGFCEQVDLDAAIAKYVPSAKADDSDGAAA